ncbi:hypothetical protein AB0K48_44035 [Nonomuraea sp. NPDC055795]
MLLYDGVMVKPHVHAAFRALPPADSVTVDSHKGGHAPYPAGGLVLRDRRAASVIASRSAYFADGDGDRPPFGPYTLEGARPGTAAAAVWAAHRLIGLHADGYGRLLGGCLATAQRLHRRFAAGEGLVSGYVPDLNIVDLTTEDAGPEVVTRLLGRIRADAAASPATSLWVSANTLATGARVRGERARFQGRRPCLPRAAKHARRDLPGNSLTRGLLVAHTP